MILNSLINKKVLSENAGEDEAELGSGFGVGGTLGAKVRLARFRHGSSSSSMVSLSSSARGGGIGVRRGLWDGRWSSACACAGRPGYHTSPYFLPRPLLFRFAALAISTLRTLFLAGPFLVLLAIYKSFACCLLALS